MPPPRPSRSLTSHKEGAPHALKPVEVASTAVPPVVLAKLGEAFAGTLSQVLADYRAFAPPNGTERRRSRLPRRLERLEALGVQVQQVARVLSGHSSDEPERMDLAVALQRVAAPLAEAPDGLRLDVELVAEQVFVLIDPAVLEHLLSLGIAYAREIGPHLILRSVAGVDGRPNLLAIEARRPTDVPHPVIPGFSDDEFDELHWLLLSLLARAAGLNPQRVASPSAVVVTLSFPLDERSREMPDDVLPRTPVAAGHSVLIVDANAESRRHARDVLEAAGLFVDAVPTVDMARGAIRDRRPEVLVTGETSDSAEIDQFVNELRAEDPELHWIELIDEPNVFALSLPGSSIPSQLSRSEIGLSLLTAVSQQIEISRY